jgi:hypothetical protein
LPSCERRPSPRPASTASAVTNPTMARRPLMRSGAGPLNASASQIEGLGCGRNKYQKFANEPGDIVTCKSYYKFNFNKRTLGDGVLGFSVCARTTKACRPSADRDRAPRRPAGKTAAPAKELMAITVAIYCAESAGREEEATEIASTR